MQGGKFQALAAMAMVALSLGAFATEAGAAPKRINMCQTITVSGSYVLDKNLSASGDCLTVQTDSLTIDLDGFTITGNGTGSGIKCAGPLNKGIEVSNGIIMNFSTGIDCGFTGVLIKVDRMRLIGNSNVGVGVNEMAIVKDSLFTENGDGINVGSRSVVTGNTSSHNTASGIVVGVGSTVIGNTAGVNGNNGIVVGNGSTVVNNTTQVNSNFGVFVTCPGNVIGNTATNNGTNLNLAGAGCNSSNNVAP